MPPRERVSPSLGLENSVAEAASAAVSLTNIRSSVWQGPLSLLRDRCPNGILHNKKKAVLVLVLIVLGAAAIVFVSLYSFHRGFRRTCQFWTRTLPWVAEYHWIKFYAHRITKCNDTEWETISQEFHKTTAFKAVRMVEQMGGIYVKMGQAISTMGSGIMPEEYVQALRPLQDGVPPRSYETISAIIEESTGRKMDDIFDSFERQPVGAATIAQAHKAILKQDPQSTPTPNKAGPGINNHSHDDIINIKQKAKKKKRWRQQNYKDHSAENNLQRQVIVKIQYPEVAELFDADLNNLELLVKLFMPSKSRDLIKNLRERHERELDFRQEADHLEECSRNMRKHGLEPSQVRIPRVRNETGLCTKNVLVMEYLHGISVRSVMEHEQDRIARALGKDSGEDLRLMIAKRIREHFEKGGGEAKGGNLLAGGERESRMKTARLWNALGPLAIHGLRHYARVREHLVQLVSGITIFLHLSSPEKVEDHTGNDNHPPEKQQMSSSRASHVNLGKVLKAMIAAHGVQVMRDGVYNLDPHPGNVLVLEDGRLGLLDYGMVGRLSQEDKLKVAATIVGIATHDSKAIAQLYLDSGYHINWENATMVTDPKLLFRIASWHFDKMDFSPITLSDGTQVDALELLDSLDLVWVPDWILQARRVSRLMMGVCAQAARPVSLAKEWERIAKQVLKESKTQPRQERRRTAGDSPIY